MSAAKHVAAQLPYRTDVTVFSSNRLLLQGPRMHVDQINDPQSQYHFRYTGLRLLLRSGDRYFLLPEGWKHGADSLFIVTESQNVRLQFTASPYN
jgi:hypothetical protein